MTRLAVAVLCAIGIGISAAAGPGDLVLGAKHAAVEFETVRISKPDGSVVTLRVPRGRPLTLLGSGGGTVLRAQTPETDRELGLRDPRPAAGAQAGARPDLTPGGGRVSLRAPTGRVDSRVRLSHPYLGTRTIEADLGAMTRGATAAAAPDRRALDDLRDPVVAGDGLAERRAGRGWRPDGDNGKDGGYVLDEFIVLEPGDGWDGPTQEPPPVGEPGDRGYDAKAIARWDVVPYQTIEDDFVIGVVAFHINGIEQVLFSVDKGPWVPVKKMQLNPRTNVWEYCVSLRPILFRGAGPIEVRAAVIPANAGLPRLLAGPFDYSRSYQGSEWTGEHSLFLTVDPTGTLPEEVIDLPAGEYVWGEFPLYFGSQQDPTRWLTYRAAPGTDPSDVIITGSTPLVPKQRNFKKIRLQNLTIADANLAWFNNESDRMIWFDRINVPGTGQWTHNTGHPQINHQFWTNCTVHDMRSGQAKHFVRNCIFYNIGEDVIREGYMILNTRAFNIDAGSTSWHSGVIANPILHDNRIYYNLSLSQLRKSVAWPMRQGTLGHWQNHDVAIINCTTAAAKPTETQVWYVGADTRHMLISGCTFDGKFLWRIADDIPDYWIFRAHDVVFKDTIINKDPDNRPQPHPVEGVDFEPFSGRTF